MTRGAAFALLLSSCAPSLAHIDTALVAVAELADELCAEHGDQAVAERDAENLDSIHTACADIGKALVTLDHASKTLAGGKAR